MRQVPGFILWLGHSGDARDLQELFRIGIGAVVDLAMEEPPASPGREMFYCRFPLLNGTGNPPWLIRAAIEMTATLLREKVPILVACGGGMSRSPVIAASALVKLGHPSLPDALLFLSELGRCDVSAALLQDVVTATA